MCVGFYCNVKGRLLVNSIQSEKAPQLLRESKDFIRLFKKESPLDFRMI
jgi:hypothetical protein